MYAIVLFYPLCLYMNNFKNLFIARQFPMRMRSNFLVILLKFVTPTTIQNANRMLFMEKEICLMKDDERRRREACMYSRVIK